VQWKSFGRQKKIALGKVLVLDRADAVNAGRKLLAKITLDRLDPHEARRERMRTAKVTLAVVVTLFLEKRQSHLRPNTFDMWKLYLTGYYFQPLHHLPIDEITREQIQTRIDDIAIQSGNTTAQRSYTAMNVLFKWALKTNKLPSDHGNPMSGVDSPKQNDPRKRVLTDDEIRLIWKTLDAWEADAIRHEQIIKASSTGKQPWGPRPPITDFPRAIKLLFLTGCRAQEIGDLQWPEVDLDNGELLIPGTRIKNAEELCNPLSDWAVQILRRIERRPGRKGVFGRSKRRDGQDLHGGDRKVDRLITQAGGTPPEDWVLHDIRRTFRTRLAELKVSMDVAERLVGHVSHRKAMERTYNRYEYWPEKRKALAMWEEKLQAIIDGTAEKIARPRFGERKKGDTA
jgi:integrase